MKYLFYITAPIITKIEDDDLRGEPRWERNVLSACLKSGCQVHTSHPVWQSDLPIPVNFYDGFNEDWAKDSLSMTHGSGVYTNIFRPAKYYIVHYFNTPSKDQSGGFLEIYRKQPGCIIATCSYRSWTYYDSLVSVF